jgi:DNA gyrase inhibitor GyrI
MSANLVYLRPLKVAYVRSTGDYRQSSVDAWERLFQWLSDNGLHAFQGCGYGLVLDNHLVTEPAQCRYDACIEASSMPENSFDGHLQSRKLPGGAYVRDRHVGEYLEIRDKMLSLRSSWSHESGLAIDDKRPLVQIFLDDPRKASVGRLRTDICVPVLADGLVARRTGSKG